MIDVAFKALVDALPHAAEEGVLSTQVAVSEFIERVMRVSGMTSGEAMVIVSTSQRLFDSLALLDRRQLREGRWQFVSFPAQLLARSLLTALADRDQDFLEFDYWEQGAHRPEELVEEQRDMLRGLETRRVLAHRRDSPEPIRFVYVAWGLIRLDGKFLLHHREDKTRRSMGNYVLPGGRFNLTDMPTEGQSADVLPLIQRAESSEALSCLERTFIREMFEETGLRCREHYQFRMWRQVKPYREVEGARNNHAYTEYAIRIFEVMLTDTGYIRLFEKLCANPDRFAWFSPRDLAQKARMDGKAAYLDALHADLGELLVEALEGVSESYVDQRIGQEETDSVDIPVLPSSPLLCGRTGKERPIDLVLSDEDRGALFGLAWHAKGLAFSELSNAVLLPSAWIKVLDASVQTRLSRLGEKLRRVGIDLIECRDQVFFRLSVAPGLIFFDESCYRYSRGVAENGQGRNCWFQLNFEAIDTPFGRAVGVDYGFPITRNTLRIIEAIEGGQDPEQNVRIKSGDIQRTIREQIDANTKPLGLRKFLRIEDKEYSIAPARTEIGI